MTSTIKSPIGFKLPGARIWNLNTYEYLKTLPNGKFDVTICDPPYTEEVHENVRNVRFVQGEDRKAYQDINFDPISDYAFARELVRVTKRWVVVFCALEQFGEYKNAVGPRRYVRSCIWHKTNAMPQLTGDRPAQAAEGIAIMIDDNEHGVAVMHRTNLAKRWDSKGKRGFYSYARATGPRMHENQKPVGLMRELVRDFSEPGERIFDPFMGSGTTGVAALLEGRKFVGVDNQYGHCFAAWHRLQAFEEERF